MLNILTFDIEDWFHLLDHKQTENPSYWKNYPSRVVGNTKRILDMLDKRNQKATFFCLGWVAEQHPSLVRDILSRGYELGSHSYCHQLAYKQSRRDFHDDLYRSISVLENISGSKIKAYRAPGFSVTQENPWVFEELIEIGITHDCSVFPARRSHGGFKGLPAEPFLLNSNGGSIKCFPMNKFNLLGVDVVFSGGGYFRLLSYQIIRQMMLRSDYVMTYFHPRDFDDEQPIIPGLSIARKFKSYVGLNGSLKKLERLVDEFEFGSLMTSDDIFEQGKVQNVRVGD